MKSQGNQRTFTSTLPGKANTPSILFALLLFIGFLGFSILSAIGLYHNDAVLGTIGMVLSLVFILLLIFYNKKWTSQNQWVVNHKLSNEGYSYEILQIKGGKTREHSKGLIPFAQMEEVLISRCQVPRNQPGDMELYFPDYIVGATLHIIWKDKKGQKQINSLTRYEIEGLEEWLALFEQHNISIKVTQIDIGYIPESGKMRIVENLETINYHSDGDFYKVIPVGSITTKEPLRLEQHFKKLHSFRIPVKIIVLFSAIFNGWFIYRIVSAKSFDFEITDVPLQINFLILGLFMYFSKKLSVRTVLFYLLGMMLYFFIPFIIMSATHLIDFPFVDELSNIGMFLSIGSVFLYYINKRILRDAFKAVYHEENRLYEHQLSQNGFKE